MDFKYRDLWKLQTVLEKLNRTIKDNLYSTINISFLTLMKGRCIRANKIGIRPFGKLRQEDSRI